MQPASLDEIFSLRSRAGIVTGAATGIGRAIATGLAGAGMTLVLADIDTAGIEATAESIQARGGNAIALACDVSRRADVERLVKTAVDAFGRLDALVNDAALPRLEEERPFFELDEAVWDRTLEVNLKGPFLCSQAAARVMSEARRGTIVNVTSQLAGVAIPHRAAYIASKGGLQALTRALAVDLGPFGIRVNALAPGPVRTQRTAPVMADPELSRRAMSKMLLGRVGQPDDLIGAAIYLCSEASAFVSGSTIVVDGGYLTT